MVSHIHIYADQFDARSSPKELVVFIRLIILLITFRISKQEPVSGRNYLSTFRGLPSTPYQTARQCRRTHEFV